MGRASASVSCFEAINFSVHLKIKGILQTKQTFSLDLINLLIVLLLHVHKFSIRKPKFQIGNSKLKLNHYFNQINSDIATVESALPK